MPYSGLLTLIMLAILGILLGMWSQRRGEGQAAAIEEETGAPVAASEAVAAEGTPAGPDPALIAVMAAAIAASSAAAPRATIRRTAPLVNYWVLSGRQEQVGAIPPNLKWRTARWGPTRPTLYTSTASATK